MSVLQKAREASKLTLAEAAKKLGISAANLRALEGEVYLPRPTEAEALRKLYGSALLAPEQGDLFA
ncbi:MAG: helix-turn-helix domain-containing protein [Candidatus Eremiobacteraeota bacterium]|nr:helix-turn-helix domain-containing protein [Candidatus Eremiobacteraeota bacterium]MCW5869257.1 helix-turn-helix domain-containing protein [Candidatus Eremiobacteraeota bacterium]